MRRIESAGNMPKPVRTMLGVDNPVIQRSMWDIHGYPHVYECANIDEVAKLARANSCEVQVLIDKQNSRYYLVAMSVDPERVKAKVEEFVFYNALKGSYEGVPLTVPDDSKGPATVVYYVEVTEADYKEWVRQDTMKRAADRIKRKRSSSDDSSGGSRDS